MKLFAALFLAVVLYGDVTAGNIPDANVVKNTWVPSLSSRMTNFAEKQLGSLQLQRLYDQRVMYKTQRVDGQAKIDELVKKLDDRLQQATTNLAAMQRKIQGLNMVHVPVSLPGCCQAPNPGKINSRFKQIVSDPFQKGCAEIQDSTKGFLWPMMKTELDANLQNTKPLTWQYYGDKYGNYYQYPTGVHSKFCPAGNYDDHRFRNWYVNTASPKKKNLVIIVDESFSMDRQVDFFDFNSPTRLEIAKEAAKTVLQTLSSDDWVGTVAFSDYARSPPGCFGDHVAQANDINKQHLVKFIDDIKPMSSTIYASGLERAFENLFKAKTANPQQFENSLDMILFLTDGAPKDKPRSKVMEAIVDGQKKMNNTVHLLLYGFGDDVARDFTSQQFLLNMADQNQRKVKYTSTIRSRTQGLVTKHLVGEKWDPYPAAGFDGSQPAGPPGMIKIIGDSQYKELKTIMSSYYNFFPIWDEQNPTVTVPFLDKNHGLVTTMGLPVVSKIDNTLSGVVAFDIPLQDMFSDISQYKIGTHSYAFLIGTDGKVLMHRNLPQPKDYTNNPLFVDLSALEPTLSEEAKKNILRGIPGFDKQLVNLPVSRGSSKFDGAVNYKLNATYFYKPLPGSKGQYTVGLVLFDMDMLQKIPEEKAGTTSGQHSTYHRLDLKAKLINKTEEICQRYGSFSSVDSTVKFAPGAFKDPDKYLQEVEAIDNVKDLESFLHSSSVTSNNDLKEYVKTDVIMTAEMEKYWKKTPESVWRYIGTETGVFRVFPGFVADKTYNPVEHAWYKRAMSRPEVYTFSRPEAGSLGDKNLVTVSRVFYQGSRNGLHDPSDYLAGVTAADITEHYFEALLMNSIPECGTGQYECSLLDDSGYFIESYATGNVQQVQHQHLTERLPWLGEYLTNKGTFLKPTWCSSVADHKAQMFYDTSDFRFTSSSPSENTRCRQFVLAAVNGTNTFLLVTPKGCPTGLSAGGSCLCADSCTLCDKFLAFCQCPCSCGAQGYDQCANTYTQVQSDMVCPVPPIKAPKQTVAEPSLKLPECKPQCSTRSNKTSCEALGHCTWCNRMNYHHFPVCTEICPDEMEVFFPCADFTAMSDSDRKELLENFFGKLKSVLPGNISSSNVFSPHNFTKDTIKFYYQGETSVISNNETAAILKTLFSLPSQFLVGPNSNAAAYRAVDPLDFTNLKVILKVPGVNMTQLLLHSLTLRQDIVGQLQALATVLMPNVAMTVDNVWMEGETIPFTIRKADLSSTVDLLATYETLKARIEGSGLELDIEGTKRTVASIDSVGSFYDMCPKPCSEGLDKQSCDDIPGCDWGDFDNPQQCSNNSYLAERAVVTAHFPCAFIIDELTPEEQEETKENFMTAIQNVLPHLSLKAIHSIRIQQGHPLHGSRISFTLQGTMQDDPVFDSYHQLNQTFRWVSNFRVGPHRNVSAYRSMHRERKYDDFTNLRVHLTFPDTVDFDQFLRSDPLNARQQLIGQLQNEVMAVFRPEVAATITDIWMEKNFIPFTISKSLDSDVNLVEEFYTFQEKVNNSQVSVHLGPAGTVTASAASYQGTFELLCPRKCSDGVDKMSCMTIPGCDWSDYDKNKTCQNNALLAESIVTKVFFPCADFTSLPQDEKTQVLSNFRNQLYGHLPNVSAKALHSFKFEENSADIIQFTLQGTMRDPTLNKTYSHLEELFQWQRGFTVGPDTNRAKYRARDPEDFTNIRMKLVYNGTDFDNEFGQSLTARQQFTSEIRRSLSAAISNPDVTTTLDNFWMEKDYIPFTFSKPVDSPVSLLHLVDNVRATIQAGVLRVIEAKKFVPPKVEWFGSFHELCPKDCSEGGNSSSCVLIPGCDWGDYDVPPICSNNSYLVERKNVTVFFPCMDLGSLSLKEAEEIRENFQASIHALLPNVSSKAIHSFMFNLPRSLSFILQGTMQDPPVVESLGILQRGLQSNFAVGPNSDPNKYTATTSDGFTMVHVKFSFKNADLVNVLKKNPLTARQEVEQSVHAIVDMVLNKTIANRVQDIRIDQRHISFAITKPPGSPLDLMDHAKRFEAEVGVGSIHVTIEGVNRVPTAVSVTGSYQDICPVQCSDRKDQLSCDAVTGCAWCSIGLVLACSNSCLLPERIVVSTSVPCLDKLTTEEESQMLKNFENKIRSSTIGLSAKALRNFTFTEDTLSFTLAAVMNDPPLNQTYRHLENLLSWSQDFRIGPDSSPSQYRTREAGDYTSMKVKVLFKGVDFDSQLMRSLSLRDQLKQELYTLVNSHMAQEVAQTVDDVWIRGNYISFSVNKTTTGQANLLSSEAAKLKAAVDQGVVNVKVSGLTLQAEDVVVEGSFEDLCPEPCSSQNGTTEMICDGRPHCHWCYLDNQPYCGDDCLLQERFSDISVFLPCLPDTLTPADEQELLQDFRSKILAIAPVTDKGIQNLTLQGQTIHFAIQAALKGLSIADARQKIQNLLAMTNFKLGTKQEPGAFTVSAADDYTNAVFTLILNGVDFDQLLARSHSLRKDIMAELEKQLTSYFSAAVVRSLGHLSLHGNNLTFALSKPKNLTSINLKSEAEAFFRAIDSGKVKAIVAGNEVKVIGKTKTFSFESMCDQECSTSTQHATCVSKPGCGWCTVDEGPYCGDNCYLTERLPYQAFIPCNRTMKFNAAEISELERNFRADLVRRFHPALTDKNIPEVTVNEEGVRFVLQGSMQVSDLSPYNKTVLDAMFSVAGRFYVGPDGKTDIPTRNKDDFTDVLMTMEFQGEDILSFPTDIIQGLKTFFSSELPAEVMSTFTVTDIQGDTITFTFYKAERSTVNLVSVAERFVQQQNSGVSLIVALASGHSLTPSRVSYTADYHSLCSGPRPAIIFTTTLSPLTTELPSNHTNGTSTGIKNIANSTPPSVPTTVMVDSTTAGNNVSTASIVFRSTSVPSSAPPGVTTIPGMPNITTATTSTKDTGISGKSTAGVKTTLHSSNLPTSGTTVSSLTGRTSSGGLNSVSSAATSGVTMTTKMGGASTGSGQSTVSMSSVSVSVTPSLGVSVGGNSNGGQGTTTTGPKSSPDSSAKTTSGNMVSSPASSAVNSQQTTQSRVTTGTSSNSTATPPGIQTSLANTYSSVDSKTTPSSPTGIKPQINVIPGKPGVGGTTPGQVTVHISQSSAAPTSALLPTSLPPSGTCAPSITIYYNGTPEALNEIIDVLTNRTNCSDIDVKNARAGLVVPPVTPLPSVNPMGPEKQILTNEKTDTDDSSQKVGLGLGIPLGILGTLAALGLLGFLWKRKKPKKTPVRQRAVTPVESFNTNIYQASMGDDLSYQFGQKGAELNRFRDDEAIFGRLNEPSAASPRPDSAGSLASFRSSSSGGSYGRMMSSSHR